MNRLRLPLTILAASAIVAVGAGFASSKTGEHRFALGRRRPPERLRIRLHQGLPVGRPDPDERGPRLRHRPRHEGRHRHERPRRRHLEDLHRHDLDGQAAEGHARRGLPGRRPRRDQGRRRRPPPGDVRRLGRSSGSATSRWRSATRSGSARASPRASSAPSTARSPRATASSSRARSRRAPRSTRATPGGALVNIQRPGDRHPDARRGAIRSSAVRQPASASRSRATRSRTSRASSSASGKVTNSDRAFLGVKIADTPGTNGVYISQVLAGTAAAKAGLMAGERIIADQRHPDALVEPARHRARGAEAGPDGVGRHLAPERHQGEPEPDARAVPGHGDRLGERPTARAGAGAREDLSRPAPGPALLRRARPGSS